jgi:dihydrolipoamide dehydrogenase
MSDEFDLVVVGAGPGGYVAAIRASQLGFKVACVDKRSTLGGTCLNVGCIPSKALLSASKKFEEASNHLSEFGIEVSSVKLNLKKMLAQKDKVVAELTKGIEFLFKKNNITWISGDAEIKSSSLVEVSLGDGKKFELVTTKVLIATGSQSTPLPDLNFDEKRVVTSSGALELKAVPDHLVVVGGGYIGLEMGSIWARLGAKVTVVEYSDRIVPQMDLEIGKRFQQSLQKQGIEFKLNTKVSGAEVSSSGVILNLESSKSGDLMVLKCDVALVAIGRRPFVGGLGLEKLGITLDSNGFIIIDEDFETSMPGVFAIGDCVPGPMLAHKAEEDGVAAVEIMAGQAGHVDYDLVPGIVYTHPEIASVGKTEEELKEADVKYVKGSFPFSANSRAKAVGDADGFVKILADAKSDKILGVHIIGPDAGTVIHECVTAMVFGASAEDIARTCHAHPTLNEAVKEAALAVDGRTIHI